MLGSPRQLPYPPTPATIPGSTRAVSGCCGSPKRSGSITAIGRAPIARMSRTMPPTPVAAPWYGSTKLGWLCDSTLKVTATWSLTLTTPAFSPMPASSRSDGGALSANWRRCTLLDLYEQCSLHMTEYIASSDSVGRRPSSLRIFSYSSSWTPSSAYGCSTSGVRSACPTVSNSAGGATGGASSTVVMFSVPLRPVGVPVDVPGHHPAAGLQLVEHGRIGDVAPLAVLDRDQQLLPRPVLRRPGAGGGLDAQRLVAVAEVQVRVADQRAGQQVGLAEDLEAVADAEDRQAGLGGGHDRAHDRREPGDRPAAQVVAVREAAGQDHRVDPPQIRIVVPERYVVGTAPADRPAGVAVVQRARERDDPDPHAVPSSTTCSVKSSITGFASSLSAISRARSRSASPVNSISIRLPMRTESTPETPRLGRAFATAWPAGSRISGLSMTSTTTRATGYS